MSIGGALGNLGRAPVPEWEEVARAAWPGRLPPRLVSAAARAHLALIVLSTAGLVVAAWWGSSGLALGLWLLAALVEWLATPADAPASRLLDLVGLRPQLRALLRSLPAAAVIFSSADGPRAGIGYVTAVLFVQLAWIAQPVLATWVSRSAPPLLYRPGVAVQPEGFTAHARVYARAVGTPAALAAAEFVVLAGSLAPGGLLPGPLLPVVVIGGVLGWLGWTGVQARGLRAGQPRAGEDLLAELADRTPSFLVYVSLAARQSKYIVNQWVPAIDALPQAGLVLVREASQLAPLAATRHPVVYGPGPKDVERLILPSVRVAFYLAYGERNGQLLREPRIKHVMLLHGDSDKATSANGMARAFDEIWVAGPMAVERYRAAGIDLPAERFVFIGRPQAAGLPSGPTGNAVPVVLYAPTFEGYYDQTAHSSLDTMGVEIVQRLLARGSVRVWFRPHPASGVSRPSMLAAIDRIDALLRGSPGGHLVVADQGLSLPECLAAADLLITDVSSVATEFLYTSRPIITCDPAGLGPSAFVAAYPTAACSYVAEPGLDGFEDLLADALGADPKAAARVELKRRVLGDPPGGPQAAFAANVARLVGPNPDERPRIH